MHPSPRLRHPTAGEAALIDLSVIILTYNEEKNIAHALASVCGWASSVIVLDSFSTDKTLDIARTYNCEIFQHAFEDYGKQRNHALLDLPIKTQWVCFLDADEWFPNDLKNEISGVIASNPAVNGYYIKRRLHWMGKWIKRGYYPTWILRLFRNGKARCEERSVNEHLIVEGPAGHLKNDFIHEDHKGVTEWIAKHNHYATREAEELYRNIDSATQISVHLFGTQAERKRWVRYKIWNRLPLLIRPFIYFSYRYIIKGGFMDGRAGFAYHFLQALWWPLLIDIKFLEMRQNAQSGTDNGNVARNE